MHRVREALLALPGYFNSTTNIEGIDVSDLFALNTMLGTTIEVQVVRTLNRIRDVWDPNDEWPLYRFDRQTQTFPDVLLRKQQDFGEYHVALGIELKGWYVLAKEAEPSFRYTVTPAACTEWDMLAVVPWHLSNVLSGVPTVDSPGLWPARYVAQYRNHWWQHIRRTEKSRAIASPEVDRPYRQRGHTSDKPQYDGGGNFGRIARVGVMDDWTQEMLDRPLAGIPTRQWIAFLKG
ncbi:MAG: hypothetical protein OXS33_00065 [bacterium]|nr:hypothetical protein [bacterium]